MLFRSLTENTSMYGQTIRQLLLSGIKFLLLTVLEGIRNVTICSLPCKRRYILAKISECMLSMDQMVGFSGHDLRGMRCQDHSFYSRNDPERCLLYDWPLFSEPSGRATIPDELQRSENDPFLEIHQAVSKEAIRREALIGLLL